MQCGHWHCTMPRIFCGWPGQQPGGLLFPTSFPIPSWTVLCFTASSGTPPISRFLFCLFFLLGKRMISCIWSFVVFYILSVYEQFLKFSVPHSFGRNNVFSIWIPGLPRTSYLRQIIYMCKEN